MMDEELTAHAEKSDGYHGVIIRLNALWRVAVCDAGIQWAPDGGRAAAGEPTRSPARRGRHAAPSPRNAPRGEPSQRRGACSDAALATADIVSSMRSTRVS